MDPSILHLEHPDAQQNVVEPRLNFFLVDHMGEVKDAQEVAKQMRAQPALWLCFSLLLYPSSVEDAFIFLSWASRAAKRSVPRCRPPQLLLNSTAIPPRRLLDEPHGNVPDQTGADGFVSDPLCDGQEEEEGYERTSAVCDEIRFVPGSLLQRQVTLPGPEMPLCNYRCPSRF